MAKCAMCSDEIGAGGITQDDGSRLCVPCDETAARESGHRVDPRSLRFCPKCSAVWKPETTACENCNYDAVSGKHIEQKVEKRHLRVSFDVGAIALAVIVLVAGGIAYDVYRRNKNAEMQAAEKRLHEMEQQQREERERAEANQRLMEERTQSEREVALAAKAQAEQEKARLTAETAAKQKEVLQKKDDLLKRQMADKERSQQEAQTRAVVAQEARKKSDIATATAKLKSAIEDVKAAYASRDKAQRQLTNSKNRYYDEKALADTEKGIDDAQHQVSACCDELRSLGVDPTPIVNPRPPVKIYTLNDGREIRALSAISVNDEVTLKDESGKIITVKKDDITGIKEDKH